jgi:hypothetical protein
LGELLVYKQIKTDYQEDFRKWLKKSKFDSETNEIKSKAEYLRHKIIVHYSKSLALDIEEAKHSISIEEIEKLKDALNFAFNTLSFNVGHQMLPVSYNDNEIRPKGVDHQTDIEDLLDCVAKNSALLNMPEPFPDAWNSHKETYDEERMKIINKYRKKFNLPEV